MKLIKERRFLYLLIRTNRLKKEFCILICKVDIFHQKNYTFFHEINTFCN